MGLWSSLCSVGSSIGSFCSSAISSISSGLSAATSYLGGALGKVVEKGLEVGKDILGTVGKIASSVLQDFDIFKENETVEDMGDRALQAHEKNIVPEQFDDFGEYLENLRNFNLDPEMTQEIKTDQKIYKGLEVAGRGLDDKFNTPTGTMAKVMLMVAQAPDYFTADRVKTILDSGMNVVLVADYFGGKLGAGEALDIEGQLCKIEKTLQPGKEDAEIYKTLDDVKNVIQGRVE